MMPDQVKKGWTLLAANQITDANEYAAIPTTEWLTEHGRNIGARIPSVAERGRALGVWQYLDSLGMEERQLFDAQGNMFDKDSVIRRVRFAVALWLRGDIDMPNVTAASPAEIGRWWQRLKHDVVAAGHHVGPHAPQDRVDLDSLARLAPLHCVSRPEKWPRIDHTQIEHPTAHRRPAPCADEPLRGPDPARNARVIGIPGGQIGGRIPFRGFAGGRAGPGLINVCAVDSILQLLEPNAGSAAAGCTADRVAAEAQRIRARLRCCPARNSHDGRTEGHIAPAEAWLLIATSKYKPGETRPIMIEYCCGDDNRNDIDYTRTLAYATHDPWDGRVFAVVTGGGHVEPIWWQGPKGVEACFAADRASLPATLRFSGDLGTIGLFAERNGIALTEQWKVGKATLAEIASGKEEKGRVADAWQEKARLHFGHDVLHTLYRNAALWQAFDPCVDAAVILLEGHFEA